ncbi:hypothetical protein POSPLADRAFT_1041671 [Postia placenta MAD-698-R-SB12]|uniref:Uncharacterized protein n=1 Tax=Postia placenta MAD-698-R-SB12 TaxID=670580 RepID=A0A1X6MM76_9APHY|nr:hypothetical protein POSPLADRAFT_1041671 [Postia placenta MAD-698-R-SB12]OSX57470.1 hypothetical protein POSPLADRAFT_1041671 [Postia placenta MAD-698-R-SB12]
MLSLALNESGCSCDGPYVGRWPLVDAGVGPDVTPGVVIFLLVRPLVLHVCTLQGVLKCAQRPTLPLPTVISILYSPAPNV